MGYSGRYHAASLAAVFISLAVGILIGIGLADDVVSSASEELETSLRSDLEAAEDRADDLEGDLDREKRFGDQILPAVVSDELAGRRVALIEFGEVPDGQAADARDAVEAAGGNLASVAEIARPPDMEALMDELPPRFTALRRDPDPTAAIGRAVGEELPGGGPLVDALTPTLFATFTGNLRGVDRVIVSRTDPSGLDPDEREETTAFEGALVDGIEEAAFATVGAELTDADPTTLQPYFDAGISTVDHLNLPAGRVSLVYALDGEEGNFGVKEEARGYLPDLAKGSAAGGSP